MVPVKNVLILFGVVGCFGQVALATVDTELLVGKVYGELQYQDQEGTLEGSDVVISGHLDPFTIPISLGLSIGTQIMDIDKWVVKDVTGRTVAFEVMGWVPNLFDFKPYATFGYNFYGKYTIKGTMEQKEGAFSGVDQDYLAIYNYTGLYCSLGLGVSPLPLFYVFVEVSYDFWGNLKLDQAKLNGDEFHEERNHLKMIAKSFLLGVGVAI